MTWTKYKQIPLRELCPLFHTLCSNKLEQMANSSNVKCVKCNKFISEQSNSICCDDCDHWFHMRCSQLKLVEFKTFVNNSDLKFTCEYCINYKCGKCCQPVFDHQNGIFCNACSKWFHLRCSKLSLIQYHELSNTKIDWICTNCYPFPFCNLDTDSFHDTMNNTLDLDTCSAAIQESAPKKLSTTCSVCTRKSKNTAKLKKLIPCQSCFSLIHRRCTKLPLTQLLNFTSDDLNKWEYIVCISEKFPFSNIDDSDVTSLTFNSNFNCNCQNDVVIKNNELNF